jgi:predicted Fe-Mo cluster-binding NifX family protein
LVEVATVAVPVFGSRVAPVFDSCTKALLIAIHHEQEVERTELSLKDFSSAERLGFIKRAGVTDLICGGISELLHTLLENSGVHVIPGIAGEVEDVVAAFMDNRLDEPFFRMPGLGVDGA